MYQHDINQYFPGRKSGKILLQGTVENSGKFYHSAQWKNTCLLCSAVSPPSGGVFAGFFSSAAAGSVPSSDGCLRESTACVGWSRSGRQDFILHTRSKHVGKTFICRRSSISPVKKYFEFFTIFEGFLEQKFLFEKMI